ncbi:MAG: MarR family transcriptional regulator, partial [Haloferacaceae archaeon]
MKAIPPAAGDLPPSSKVVLLILEGDGWMSVNDLLEATHLDRTTLHHALQRLLETPLVERRPSPHNPRGHEYRRR